MTREKKYLSDLSDEELIEMYKDLYDVIYNADCFSTKDIVLLCEIEKELVERGYKIYMKTEIVKEE